MITDAPTYYMADSPGNGDHYWLGYPRRLEMSREQHARCEALAAQDGGGYWTLDAIMPERGALIYCDGPGRYYHVRHNGSAQEVSFDYVEDADRD